MTITLQAVNELIASLDSAGQLSIREQKFLKLAKEFRICSASLDAVIRTGNALADQNAQLAAENVALKSFGDKLNDMHNALNGEGTGIQGRAEVSCQQVALEAAMEEFDAIETPATDACLAGIKADGRAEGINFAASRLAAAFNHGFVDKPMAEVGDVVRMILDAKADLANSQIPAEDGLSGEYAEKSLAEWEAVLREGADKC
ncbi:hypothetical protein [Klebsiella quasipneumoniae]|uniref:hypothetical protein n=1 Tax=Klebsiella quasipneumoniae TaxID=1463165 RepID=UPI001FB68731|nr:hypothetical protein [Klebsiella quasipneumoniae]MCJ1857400.1 hypothetical protein [Klebsiella quasipneumoniae subsp. similipneumoniae]